MTKSIFAPGTTTYVQDYKFEQALRKFKNKVEDFGIIKELREREAYVKPTTARKTAKAKAKKRHQKKMAAELLPKKVY